VEKDHRIEEIRCIQDAWQVMPGFPLLACAGTGLAGMISSHVLLGGMPPRQARPYLEDFNEFRHESRGTKKAIPADARMAFLITEAV